MAFANIRFPRKSAAWFTAEATRVLLDGQMVFIQGQQRFKIGDGVTQLQNLLWYNAGSTLAETLVNGNTTSGKNIAVSNADKIEFSGNSFIKGKSADLVEQIAGISSGTPGAGFWYYFVGDRTATYTVGGSVFISGSDTNNGTHLLTSVMYDGVNTFIQAATFSATFSSPFGYATTFSGSTFSGMGFYGATFFNDILPGYILHVDSNRELKRSYISQSGTQVNIGDSVGGYPTNVRVDTGGVSGRYGIAHKHGSVEITTYADNSGGWFGTKSNHSLFIFTADGNAQAVFRTDGNFALLNETPNKIAFFDSNKNIKSGSIEEADIELVANKGQAGGYAPLDGGGKIPATHLPETVMSLEGEWNAATNTPTLANGTGDAGMVYECTVAGSTDFGAGAITFKVGDWAVYANGIWYKSINSNEVTSVNGFFGTVNLTTDEIPQSATKLYVPAAAADNDFVVGVASTGTWIKKTLAQVKTILGLVFGSTAGTYAEGNDSRFGRLYTWSFGQVTTFLNSSNYFFGSLFTVAAGTTAAGNRRIYFHEACTITGFEGFFLVNGVLGSSDNNTISIRIDNTTDHLVSNTVTLDAMQVHVSSNALNIPVAANSFMEIKLSTKTTGTAPTNILGTGTVRVSVP